ncbi:uncharacterized protein LOC127853635 isoform X3 [Dreissena polymorpha]|uniref:uncharacterized protein LOC127853635 isoform X3 n=1 Tax=Dreissena polymorpha TaxID=45954 RepID=UPI002264BDE0|nr:uncharacterized protein LOC127853635 isoform X3 [Dreissena polymorpha]
MPTGLGSQLLDSIDQTQQYIVKCQEIHTETIQRKWTILNQMLEIIKDIQRNERCQPATCRFIDDEEGIDEGSSENYQENDVEGSDEGDNENNQEMIDARPISEHYYLPLTVREEDYGRNRQNDAPSTGQGQSEQRSHQSSASPLHSSGITVTTTVQIAQTGQGQSEQRPQQSSASPLHSSGLTVKTEQAVDNAQLITEMDTHRQDQSEEQHESSRNSKGKKVEAKQAVNKAEQNAETVVPSTSSKRQRKKKKRKMKLEEQKHSLGNTSPEPQNTAKMGISKKNVRDDQTANDSKKKSRRKISSSARELSANAAKAKETKANLAKSKFRPKFDLAKSSDSTGEDNWLLEPTTMNIQHELAELIVSVHPHSEVELKLAEDSKTTAGHKKITKQLICEALRKEIEKHLLDEAWLGKRVKQLIIEARLGNRVKQLIIEALRTELAQQLLPKVASNLASTRLIMLKPMPALKDDLHLEYVFRRVNSDQQELLSLLFSLWTYNIAPTLKELLVASEVVTMEDVVHALEDVSSRMITSANIFPETIRMFVHFPMLNRSAERFLKCGKGNDSSSARGSYDMKQKSLTQADQLRRTNMTRINSL